MLDASNPRKSYLIEHLSSGSGLAWWLASPVPRSLSRVNASLQVLDASNPRNLTLLSTYPADSEYTDGVAVSDTTVFVADNIGLKVLDASNPRNLTLLSTYLVGSEVAWGVSVSGSTVFVTDGISLQVLDASNPRNLSLLSTYPVGSGAAWGVSVSGSTVFVADDTGLQVLDASNPRNLTLLSTYPGSLGQTFGVAVSGSTVFVADLNVGLQVLDMSQQTLTGTPSQADVRNYKLELVATDIYGGNISAPFTLRVEGPPQIHRRIPLQYAPIGQAFNYFIPQGLITDPNNDPISFGAQLSNGQPLPSWLSFNTISATFTGTPGTTNAGTFNISLSSTDNLAGFTNTSFLLFVGTPIISTMLVHQGRFFSFAVPSSVFNVKGIPFSNYSALQKDSSTLTLPSWLAFNASTLVFEGALPFSNESETINLQIMASNGLGDELDVPFSFRIIPNQPFQVSPPSIQVATAKSYFSFVASHIFNQPNEYALTYSAQLVGGKPLPAWLSFNNSEPPVFFGEPGHGDTDFYAPRLLQIQLNASDGMVNGSSPLLISVGGTSWGQLAITIASPSISFLVALYSAYKLRGLVLNRCAKGRYQQGTIEKEVGEQFRLTLQTPAEVISDLAVRFPAQQACSRCCQFFKLPQSLPGGATLPLWMEYNPETNEIRTKTTIPVGSVNKNFIIQASDANGVILEEYTLIVLPKALHPEISLSKPSTFEIEEEKNNNKPVTKDNEEESGNQIGFYT